MKTLSTIIIAAILTTAALPASAATAPTVNKTWVSSTGSDTGSCQLVAPCKTFAYAIGQTNAGGEIDVKDSGAYGAFTIDKAITIVAAGVVASVGIGADMHAINITAASGDTVDIVGLTVNTHSSQQTGAYGIVINCGGCVVALDHLNVEENYNGISVAYGSSNPVVILTNSHVTSNTFGVVNSTGTIYIGQDSIVGNNYGVEGHINSYGNNVINGNKVADLAPYITTLYSAALR